MRIVDSQRRRASGFSLLEVLIAVVVLSVGLLALAALQGSVTQSSADAKVRGRIAAMLSARMDTLRSRGYGSITVGGPTTVTSTTGTCDATNPDDWLDCAREQAALGSLSVTQTVALVAFATPNPAQYKRITLGASWPDATGQVRRLEIASDVSSLALVSNFVTPPEPEGSGGSGPIVRTTNPATAGVVPIALSVDAASATTNPMPELVGKNKNQQIVGTRFSVLNYTPPGSDGAVVMQKRFETEVVKCSCQYGRGGNNLPPIYRTPRWPAIWTGDRYDVYVPEDPAIPAPGVAANAGPKAGAKQSPLCQECCRDHHDASATATADARFDPERSDGLVSKFDKVGTGALVLQSDTSAGTYLDACRLIRVDGFWRTASDMYARQYGLLETEPEGDQLAKSGLPTSNAVNAYTGFVKDFLAGYDGTNPPPADGQARFDATAGINVPALVTIPSASASDYRYLHGRALYVDYLEAQARDRIADVVADTGPQGACRQGTPAADCVMPYLPFTTINLTEIARWVASDEAILTVNSSNLLATDPAQPSGGRTFGKAPGTAETRTSLRQSNSGVAANSVLATVDGVDPGDDTLLLTDAQPFEVGGSALGPTFDVRVTGGGGNPQVFFTLGSDLDQECVKPAGADHRCQTAAGTTLPQAGTVRVANYWLEASTSQSVSHTCSTSTSSMTATATIEVPTFRNFEVTAATIGGVAGATGPATDDGTIRESTSVTFSAIAANDLVAVTLSEQAGSPVYATIESCTTVDGTTIDNIVWSYSWKP